MKKLCLLCTLLFINFYPANVQASPFPQKCSGYLVNSTDFGITLAKNVKGESFDGVSWCDASFGNAQLKTVLSTCSLGGFCRIEGLVQGHGVFNWVRIDKVSNK